MNLVWLEVRSATHWLWWVGHWSSWVQTFACVAVKDRGRFLYESDLAGRKSRYPWLVYLTVPKKVSYFGFCTPVRDALSGDFWIAVYNNKLIIDSSAWASNEGIALSCGLGDRTLIIIITRVESGSSLSTAGSSSVLVRCQTGHAQPRSAAREEAWLIGWLLELLIRRQADMPSRGEHVAQERFSST